MRLLIILTFSWLSISLFCQPATQIDKRTYDFGTVANLNYPPASFEIKNTGNKPLAILMVNKSNAIKVSYPRVFIEPEASGNVLVLPNLNKIGKFRETISIVTNASNQPIEVEITGEVVSIQACFPNPDDWTIRKVVVIDTDTKKPIPETKINFTHNMSQKLNGETNNKGEWTGELPIGQYAFHLQANNYRDLNESRYVGRSVPILFFEMEMIPPEAPQSNIAITEPEIKIEELEIPVIPAGNNDILPVNLYAANNLVLLLDVSYSMKSNSKLELLKESSINLVKVLRSIDNVSLITYAGTPSIVIESVPGNKKDELYAQISALKAAGITNGVKGLESAFSIANSRFIQGGNNQIILATDGKFTGGTQQPEEFKQMIADYAEKGIILSIIGFGVDEEAKEFMNGMSQLGRGTYIHVTTKDDISETLINEIKAKSIK
jgi:hypothetical protein